MNISQDIYIKGLHISVICNPFMFLLSFKQLFKTKNEITKKMLEISRKLQIN